MPLPNVMTAFEARVADDDDFGESGGLITQRYPAIARDVELSREELRESGMLDVKLHLDRKVSELRRRAAPLKLDKA